MTLVTFQNVAAFILAGGASERMGRDKALLELGGLPMVARTAQLASPHVTSIAIVAPHEQYSHFGFRILADRWPGAGPLGGIATALCSTSADWNLVLGCDLPYLTPEWVAWLISRALKTPAHAIVPESRRGLEPVAAVYHKNCGPVFTAAIERGVRGVVKGLSEILFERLSATEWPGPGSMNAMLENMNTPEDYAEARRRIEGVASP